MQTTVTPNFSELELQDPRVQKYLELVSLGLAKCTYEPDEYPHDISYVDTWDDLSAEQREEEKENIWRLIELHGRWGLRSFIRLHTSHTWVEADSLWDVICEPEKYDEWYSLVIGAVTMYELETSLAEKYQ